MKYLVEITDTAYKELKRLDKPTRRKFDKAITYLTDEPFRTKTEKLVNHPAASFRHRIGDYRILFNLLPENIIQIVHIWHRGKDYKK